MPAKKQKKLKKSRNQQHSQQKRNQWEDHLTKKAKSENYPARSVYKLEEIQNRFKILKKRDLVLDLGCAPGSWLLYASKQVGKEGQVTGVDLKKTDIRLPVNVSVIQNDILMLEERSFLNRDKKFNVVLSDMAPSTTGRKDVDSLKSFELCNMALKVAEDFLDKNGSFICKIFQGNDFNSFQKNVKLKFQNCKIFKPKSCRKQSKEIYVVAKGMK